MSVELPEAKILAAQINEMLVGKKVASHEVMDSEKLQRIGFTNRDLADYEMLDGQTILGAESGGNTVHLRLSGDANMVISPEYGGRVQYHEKGEKPSKHHLKLNFTDGSSLTIRLTSMGVVSAARSMDLEKRYTYRRDFMGAASPDSPEFTFEYFRDSFSGQNRALKPLLVGKDALVVGLSNSAFQDVLYCAGRHPKRKASGLTEEEGGYTVGVLVQANYGSRELLTVAGAPVGREIPDLMPVISEAKGGGGSIIVVVATDAPLLPHQLKRLARRAPLGISKVGGIGSDGSGDIFIAFSTANPGAHGKMKVSGLRMLSNDRNSPLFLATVQATEEAIVNALVAAETMTGIDGNTVYAIPHDRLVEALRKYNRLTT